MKAWILSSEESPETCSSLVWAESRGRAKAQANYDGPYMYQCDLEAYDFTSIRAIRAKSLDNCEEFSEKEICLRLVKEYGWIFYIGDETYDEDNVEEFEKLFWREKIKGERNMKLKCKKCGNEDDFYIIEKFSGVTELCVDSEGELTDYNADAYEHAEYKLKSVYYYCCECRSKVAKIPEEKRY